MNEGMREKLYLMKRWMFLTQGGVALSILEVREKGGVGQ